MAWLDCPALNPIIRSTAVEDSISSVQNLRFLDDTATDILHN